MGIFSNSRPMLLPHTELGRLSLKKYGHVMILSCLYRHNAHNEESRVHREAEYVEVYEWDPEKVERANKSNCGLTLNGF